MAVKQLAPLGSPARVRVTKVVRTSYRIEWEYDGTEGRWEDDSHSLEYRPVRRRQVRHMQVRQAAYRAAAMRLIFARRNRYSKEINDGKYQGCTLCDTHPVWSEGDGMGHTIQQACRYHSSEHVELLRDRLARWLLWRDSRAVGP